MKTLSEITIWALDCSSHVFFLFSEFLVMSKKTLPELYSPIKTIFLSFVFTPIFGALLFAKNWEVMGDKTAARLSRLWSRTIVWVIGLYIVMQVVFIDEPLMNYAGPYVLLVMWLGWFFASGLKHYRQVKAWCGEENQGWRAKPLGRTIVVGGLLWVLYMMTTISIGMGIELFGLRSHVESVAPASTSSTTDTNPVVIRRDSETGKAVVETVKPAPQSPQP